jgi:excinuclease ABC subunit C
MIDFSKIVKKIPELSGVYLYRDINEKLLYIGKAINLKKRVGSYFLNSHDDRPQIPVMLKKLVTIDWIVTENETEALVLESNLVKEHQPPYNIELRDDKHYPFIKITTNEVFPRILITRKVEQDGCRYFGPFTDAGQIRRTVTNLRKLLQIRSCSLKLDEKSERRECIDYSMNLCSGCCNKRISVAEYGENIKIAIQFFKGKRKDILNLLEDKMKIASSDLKFEVAAKYRDQLVDIKKLIIRQGVDLRRPDLNCDVFGLFIGANYSALTTLLVRGGVIINQNSRVVRGSLGFEESPSMLILDYYSKTMNELPDELILAPIFEKDAPLIKNWFSQKEKVVDVVVPKIGDKVSLINRAEKSSRLFLSQKYLTDGPQLLEELAKACNLPRVPSTIEAFDISNLGDKFCVAGMVHFADGSPVKSNYRRFKIKGVSGQNDFAMMMEAVDRRLTRLQNEDKPFPDLLLIDGGKGQLSAAAKAISHFENPPMLLSLAKKEELLISRYTEEPVQLGEGHPVRRLMERIRDEVHRFAITYHRKLRGRQFNKSLLEEVKGVGPKKVKALLKTFESAEIISKLSIEEISKVSGVSEKDAFEILKELKDIF